MLFRVTTASVGLADTAGYAIANLVLGVLTAVGTVGATVIAVVLAVRASRDQLALREERIRAQADQVVLVLQRGERGRELVVRNLSYLPIHQVHAVSLGAPSEEDRSVDLLSPDDSHTVPMSRDEWGVAVVEFGDAEGRRWARTSLGRLHRLAHAPGLDWDVQAIAGDGPRGKMVTELWFAELAPRGALVPFVGSGAGIKRRHQPRFWQQLRWRASGWLWRLRRPPWAAK
jgi:hypothetical protein